MAEKTKTDILQNAFSEFNTLAPRYIAASLGTQFKNNRDFYQVFGWESNISSSLLYSIYKAHGIAKAVNDTPVTTTWRYYPTVKGSSSFETSMGLLNKRIKLFDTLKKADRLSGVSFYSIIVLNIKNQSYKSKLRSFQMKNLTSVSVYADHEVQIIPYLDEKTKSRYGIKAYKIGMVEVHPSRVIHVAENSDNGVQGQSRLAPIYNQLMDMWKISGSTAELYYISASLLLNAKAMDGFKVNKGDATELQDGLLEVVNKMKGFLITNGFEVENIAPDITSPKDSWDVMEKFISSTSAIPRRVLFGSEMGELASTQDQSTYYERIESRQTNHVTPNIINTFIDKCMVFSDLEFSDYDVTWQKLSALSEKDVSEAVRFYATSLKSLNDSLLGDSPIAIAVQEKMLELIKGN